MLYSTDKAFLISNYQDLVSIIVIVKEMVLRNIEKINAHRVYSVKSSLSY